MSRVHIEAGIDEIDIGKIEVGQIAAIVAEAYGRSGGIAQFNRNLFDRRNDPDLHQALARAFHPYYVTKDENFSSNDCPGGWRLCDPPAVYDMSVRKITSCSGILITSHPTFSMMDFRSVNCSRVLPAFGISVMLWDLRSATLKYSFPGVQIVTLVSFPPSFLSISSVSFLVFQNILLVEPRPSLPNIINGNSNSSKGQADQRFHWLFDQCVQEND